MKYRKKPVVVEAVQWNTKNKEEIEALIVSSDRKINITGPIIMIETLEGMMQARPRDYIIKGVHGEIYPCKPDIFEETYELAE